jgi:hypothetical protein
MRNAGQSMGEFSDAIAAQPGNQMRGGDLWTRQGGGGLLSGMGGAQTYPAAQPPQFQNLPLGTMPQHGMAPDAMRQAITPQFAGMQQGPMAGPMAQQPGPQQGGGMDLQRLLAQMYFARRGGML